MYYQLDIYDEEDGFIQTILTNYITVIKGSVSSVSLNHFGSVIRYVF